MGAGAVAATVAAPNALARTGPPPIPCVSPAPPGEDEPPACPIQGHTVVVKRLAGVVFVTLPGRSRRKLGEARSVPVGSVVDATHGRYRLMADQRRVGIRFATSTFYGGAAKVVQGFGSAGATLDMQLASENNAVCAHSGALTAARRHPAVQGLWGDGKGHIKSSGRYASAAVRGTKWNLTDFCDGSGVTVRHGTVAVNAFATGTTVLVGAGHSFFAPASATFTFPVTCPAAPVPFGSVAAVTGTFSPGRPPSPPLVDYRSPSGATITHSLVLDAAGAFADSVTATEKGVWTVNVHLADAQPNGVPGSCSFSVA
ncbi:MAG: hypothetical protein NVS1B9_05290 [Solirubrobacteraceae bacterium]